MDKIPEPDLHGNQDLIAYLQRLFGYSLTGSVQEHALFFCYGTGANGKGVLLGTCQNILKEEWPGILAWGIEGCLE